MAALDQNAQSDAQGAQQLHNTGVESFVRVLAELLSRLRESEVRIEDLTLMSGTKKVFPGDNANDIELSAKLKDAFTNSESKASVRVFLEYADGTKEEIFRQTAGKVVRDDFGLAPELRNMYAQQKADGFGLEVKPKVTVELDGKSAENGQTAQAEQSLETVVQSLKKPTREDIAAVPPMSDEQINQEIERIKAKAPETRNLEVIGGLTPQQAYQIDDAQLKHAYLTAQYVKGQLLEIHGQSKAPGNEHLLTDPTTMDLRAKYDAVVKTVEDRLAIVHGVKAEPVAEVKQPEPVKKAESTNAVPSEVDSEYSESDFYAEHPEFLDHAVQRMTEEYYLSPEHIKRTDLNSFIRPPSETQAQKTERWMLDAIAPKTAVVAVPTVEHIASIAEVSESLSLAHHAGQTLEMLPAKPSDHTGDALKVAPFLFEVASLSSQIESLRDRANAHLSGLNEFAADMRQAAEPRLQQWSERVEAAVEVKSNTWRDRLQNMASSLIDTVKNRAISDVKIVVEVVKDRAAEDWTKTVDVAKGGASNAWESAQRFAIGSDAVDRGIDTLINYVGQKNGSDGMAELDGYTFARKGSETGIFRDGETVYQNGLMTDKAKVADSAYIARFPNVAQKAAEVVEAMNKSQSLSQTQGVSAGAARRR